MKKKANSIESLKEEGLVTTADKVFIEKEKMMAKDIFNNVLKKRWEDYMKETWAKQIEDYCSSVGILPEDLILAHKSLNKPFKSKKATNALPAEENDNLPTQKPSKFNSNWNENYRKQKLGLK